MTAQVSSASTQEVEAERAEVQSVILCLLHSEDEASWTTGNCLSTVLEECTVRKLYLTEFTLQDNG